MTWIETFLRRMNLLEEDDHNLRVSVYVLLMHIIIYPLFGPLFLMASPNSVDNYSSRFLASSPTIGFLLLLAFVPSSRKYSQLFVTFATTTMTLQILWLIHQLHLEPTYIMGCYAVLSACTALIVRIPLIVIYTAISMLGATAVALSATEPKFHPLLFLALAAVEAVLAATINIQKLLGYLNIGKERKKLVEAEKMASIGILAAGVAHEFNNPLAIIDGKSTLLMKKIDKGNLDPQEMKNELERIRKTVSRLANIVRSLLDMAAKPSNQEDQACTLDQAINNAAVFVQGRIEEKGIKLDLPSSCDLRISGNIAQHSQILISLLSNSIDAISELESSVDKWIKISIEQESADVIIRVADSGLGIPADILEKIFLPFFTTKPPGAGTGIGLSLARASLARLGGDLGYNLKSGNTEFFIRIPCAVA